MISINITQKDLENGILRDAIRRSLKRRTGYQGFISVGENAIWMCRDNHEWDNHVDRILIIPEEVRGIINTKCNELQPFTFTLRD